MKFQQIQPLKCMHYSMANLTQKIMKLNML